MKLGAEVEVLQIMLCGAHDVGELSGAFTQVVRDFAAEPWFYQQGKIQHINSSTSRWTENSRATVKKVDVCVFVILDRHGDITWGHELQQALDLGKPFVVLALESSWIRYNNLLHSIADAAALVSDDDRRMVELLRMISSDYQITVTPFTYPVFQEKLRSELSGLFLEGVRLLEKRNQRAALLNILEGVGSLSQRQKTELITLATDEYEANKLERKTALRRLAAEGVRDFELIRDVCRSPEQGVQRLGFDLLPDLIPLPPDETLLNELAQIAGGSDDVGIPRRFISSVAQVAPTLLDIVLNAAGSLDEGVRRRAFEGVETHYDDVLANWGYDRTERFLRSCEAKGPVGTRWIDRLRMLLEKLNNDPPT